MADALVYGMLALAALVALAYVVALVGEVRS